MLVAIQLIGLGLRGDAVFVRWIGSGGKNPDMQVPLHEGIGIRLLERLVVGPSDHGFARAQQRRSIERVAVVAEFGVDAVQLLSYRTVSTAAVSGGNSKRTSWPAISALPRVARTACGLASVLRACSEGAVILATSWSCHAPIQLAGAPTSCSFVLLRGPRSLGFAASPSCLVLFARRWTLLGNSLNRLNSRDQPPADDASIMNVLAQDAGASPFPVG